MESDYDRKFEEMKKYIPFLESMIRKLENTGTGSVNPRQAQLSKIRALRDLLLDKNKRMKMDNLLKCEQVLVNLYAKVESRDTLPGIQKAPQSTISPSRKQDFESIRRKLKAASVQENEETLPEIARANQTQVECTSGSKEPALFQRRPNRGSPSQLINIQDQSYNSKRSYTRVLVSPPPTDCRRDTTVDQRMPDNHLFHRRSPKKSPNKRDRKKSSKRERKGSRSDNNLNITLNVPEESLNSLNTEDIFDRIINCDNSDVDIGTLRDLRTQILSELKQTGTNEDISGLILKSYRNKNKKNKKAIKKPDIEEGELSDSESEAIENIYGSLVIVDGDKDSGRNKETIKSAKDSDKVRESSKIQINLVISNSNQEKKTENAILSNVENTKPNLSSDFNKSNTQSEIVSEAINVSSESCNLSTKTTLNTTEDELLADEAPTITFHEAPKTSYEEKTEEPATDDINSKNTSRSDHIAQETNTDDVKTNEPNMKIIDNKRENKANFYVPMQKPEVNEETKVDNDKDSVLEEIEKLFNSNDEDDEKDNTDELKHDQSSQIPFLSEASSNVNTPKEKKTFVSEIDILQALKNEILSETIAIPGAEVVETPALHQPKITKVANAQEIAVKKKISLENYKKKSAQKPLFSKETPLFESKLKGDVSQAQVPSRGLTAKEMERFNIPCLAPYDSSDEAEEKQDLPVIDVYADLAPKSPDEEVLLGIDHESPVIIPEEQVKAPVVELKADVDMRTLRPIISPQAAKSLPLNSTEPAPYKPPNFENIRSNETNTNRPCDPRKRRDYNPSINSDLSNSPQLLNPGGTPRAMPNFLSKTPSRMPNMTPSRAPNMTPCMTPNAKSFEMTPSHNFEYDDQSSKHKHVYAPVMWEISGRDITNDTSSPRWETNDTRSSTSQEGMSNQNQRWSDRNPRSSLNDESSDYRDKQQQRRDPRFTHDRRDDRHIRSECPPTPSHYFGRGDYPSTPTHPFGRSDGNMTPVHPFGRSDYLTTPSHPFGRSDCPNTPSHPFGRSDCPNTPSHPFGRSDCPNTPSHPFGRSDCPNTPSHPFGRTDCPSTPSHPFGRSDCPATPSHPFSHSAGYHKEQRYSRSGNYDHEDDSSSYTDSRQASNYKLDRYSGSNEMHNRLGRERSVGRNDQNRYGREKSVGKNDENRNNHEPSIGRRHKYRDSSVGRLREPSTGRLREPSIGREREPSIGHINRDCDDRLYSTNNPQGRRSGNRSQNDSVPCRSYAEVGRRRERSVGRTFPSDSRSSSRAQSIGRIYHEMPADNTVSVESHAGRSFFIDTSVNSTFQAIDLTDETSRLFDARRKRATSVGRSFQRGSSIGRSFVPDYDVKNDKSNFRDKNVPKFIRARSVGRDLVDSGTEKSFKDIKAHFESFKTKLSVPYNSLCDESREKNMYRATEHKKDNTELKGITLDATKIPIIKISRDPRCRKVSVNTNKNKITAYSKKDEYFPKKNLRDPRLCREKYTTSDKYKIDHRQHDKFFGIVYTNEAIAKGNILGPGYGVKNYKIPKIKRPPEESEKETDLSQAVNEKEIDTKESEIKTRNNKKRVKDAKTDTSPKVKLDVKKNKKAFKVNDSKISDDVSPIRTRKTRKSIVYSDIDSESENDTESVAQNSEETRKKESPIKRNIIDNSEIKSDKNTKIIENNDTDGLEFTFDIQDDLFTENVASDADIDNINDLIADLDKDIGATKNEESITDLTKDSFFDKILENLTFDDNTNVVAKNIQIDTNVLEREAKNDQIIQKKSEVKEKNIENESTESMSNKSILEIPQDQNIKQNINEKESQKSNETKNTTECERLSNVNLKIDNNEAVSTSIPEDSNLQKVAGTIDQKSVENSEACLFPDSTINTDDSTKPKIFQDKPDSTNDAQTEMNSDITSTHDSVEATSKNITAEACSSAETTALKSDSLESILSLLKDKSKLKELLGMLDDQSDNEKLKKKLEKLSEIVSDEEDTRDKSEKTTEEIVKVTVDDSQSETTSNGLRNIQIDIPCNEILENTINEKDDKIEINTGILHETNKNKSNETSTEQIHEPIKEQVHETNEEKTNEPNKEIVQRKTFQENIDDTKSVDESSINNDHKISSSEDEDNEPIALRPNSRAGKRGRKGKRSKKLNKSKVQINVSKRVTRSESTLPKRRPYKKRNRELQSLQEDIRDMFISDDVLNATGIRMCRLAKLVEDKNKSQSNESSNKTSEGSNKSDVDLREDSEPGPVVILEKFLTTKKKPAPTIKPMRKKPGPKPKPKPQLEKPTETKTTEKTKPGQAYRPGPKSKTKVHSAQNCDPYEFEENDSISETTTKTSENTPFNSDSDSESLNSLQSFGSSENLLEKKPKAKKRRNKWQLGVIKTKKTKRNTNKLSPRPVVGSDHLLEPIIAATPTRKIPDMDCFIDENYYFIKDTSSYACRLCKFEGESIVHHYKKEHPHYEIPLSRMHPHIAFEAIKQATTTNFQNIRKVPISKYVCRFCMMVFEDKRKSLLEAFFWHVVSMHTGEYKQLCPECLHVKKCTFMLEIPPPPKDGKGLLMGYICGKCNYTQVSLENLKKHVSLRHNDEETEVYTISLGVVVEMKAIEDSPRSLRSLRSNNSSTSEDKSAQLAEIKKKPRPRDSQSVQSKIQFETDAILDQLDDLEAVVKSETEAENSEGSHNLTPMFEKTFDDHHENLATDIEASATANNAIDKLTKSSTNELSLDVFTLPHFKINYTDSGNKEYLCCINGQYHYKTSLLISMKKHVQTKHVTDSWDGYCSVCKVIVMSQGIHKFKDCLAHLLDKHAENFPEDIRITESPRTYLNVRPISELISNQSNKVNQHEDPSAALPKIESVVSLNTAAVSNQQVTEEPQLNPIIDTNTYNEHVVAHKEIIEIHYEEAQKGVMSRKHRIVLDMMMAQDKIGHMFKCAGRYCSFTCSSTEDALVHASTHQRVGGVDALICSYCCFDAASNAIDLVSHVFKEHGACQFSCKACFYRAFTNTLVEAHYIRVHGAIVPGAVLQAMTPTSFSKRPDESEGLLSRQEAVKHYVCCSDGDRCKFKTFTSGKFIEHLTQKHPDKQSHDCNECPYIASSSKDLLVHLQSHGLRLYQCTWCVFGTDTENEMLMHASIKHPMKRPQAYLRHIIESKDNKFKVLPFVHITKKSAIVPVEVPIPVKLDNPVREAERALELEKLIGHTDKLIQNDASESSPIASLLSVLEQNEPFDSQSVSSATAIENQLTQQIESLPEPLQEVTPTTNDADLPVTEHTTPHLKIEPTEVTPKEGDTQKRIVSDVIYCLDSDEEESNQEVGVIELSDDNESNVTPPKTVDCTNAIRNIPIQLYSLLQLFKCVKCEMVLRTKQALKRHFQSCFPDESDVIPCPYCTYKTADRNNLLNHYTSQHQQLDKYTCSICKHEESSSRLIRNHFGTMHQKNKLSFRIDSQRSSQIQYIQYIVQALDDPPKRGRRKRSTNDTPSGAPPSKVRRFGPEDIKLLPLNQIFDESAQCMLCEFSTKVRQNLIRHLQLHSQQQSVPEIAPVNPVPHLETNEMHFDKMLNLASSSIANKTSEKSSRPESETAVAIYISPEAAARYPKYIPERQRYACGAKDCSYISIDEAMLKCHWETLHSGSNVYHCVHCPPNQQMNTSSPLTAARIIAHLKMHDVKLFTCSECSYYHHQQHILDKHLTDKHNGNAQMMVVRGPNTAPPSLVPTQPAANAPTMDLKPWQCGLCKFKSMLRPEVVDHCFKQHQSKFQYKCAFCPWRTSTLENVTKHHSNSHSGQEGDVFYFYYREGSISDEPDGTSRWMKQRQKAGLPMEHDVKIETQPSTALSPSVSTPITIQPPPALSVDLNIVKSEIIDPASPHSITVEDLCKQFGDFCEPNGIKYRCSLCKQTMEDTKEAMQSHLYEELQYRKWGCSVCSYRAFHKKGLKEHAFHEHRKNLEPVEISSNKQIETWVEKLLEHQEEVIKKNFANFQNLKIITPEKNKPSTSQSQKKNENASSVQNIGAEDANLSKQELVKYLGPFGQPKNFMFTCPKCDTRIKEESKMIEHLEMELSQVRWCCSNCSGKFQHYHQAQLHCKSVHYGQSARAVEAVRDPKIRSAWIAAVIQVQMLSMNIMPISSVTSAPARSMTSKEPEPENSLLVVRYEENVPNPETSKPNLVTRRKRPSFMDDSNSDEDDDEEDERLIIDEDDKWGDSEPGIKCPYCEFRSPSRGGVNDHMLRHYNLKPYRCGYCDFNAYNKTMYKHLEKMHPGKERSMTKVKVPDTPPTEIHISLSRGSAGRKKIFKDFVICLYCDTTTFNDPSIHSHPNRSPQLAKLGEKVLKCNHCVTYRKDIFSMREHFDLCHPSMSLDVSYYVIRKDRESRVVCTTKKCRRRFCNIEDLKTHHELQHAGLQLHFKELSSTGQFHAVRIEGQQSSAIETVDVSINNDSDETFTGAKRKSDNPPAPEPKRFAKKSTTKLPYSSSVAKKSTTKLPFNEQDSDNGVNKEEEYSYYGTAPASLDGYANISTLMSLPNSADPVPVTLPVLCDIVDIDPKIVLKDVNQK